MLLFWGFTKLGQNFFFPGIKKLVRRSFDFRMHWEEMNKFDGKFGTAMSDLC